MKKKPQKPIAVRVGNVTVKTCRSNRIKAGQSYTQLDVADYTSGRRKESGPVCEIARTPDAIRRLAESALA